MKPPTPPPNLSHCRGRPILLLTPARDTGPPPCQPPRRRQGTHCPRRIAEDSMPHGSDGSTPTPTSPPRPRRCRRCWTHCQRASRPPLRGLLAPRTELGDSLPCARAAHESPPLPSPPPPPPPCFRRSWPHYQHASWPFSLGTHCPRRRARGLIAPLPYGLLAPSPSQLASTPLFSPPPFPPPLTAAFFFLTLI